MPAPQRIEVKRKRLEAYRDVVGDELVAEARELAYHLDGLRVLELSSTATGGGVAEMLSSLIPLEQDVGLDAEWHVIAGDRGFFDVTKKLHNGLQGMDVELSESDRATYLRANEANAAALATGWDVVVVHDPQPAAIRAVRGDLGGRWLWRCHIDSSTPDAAVWSFLRPYVEQHDLAAFTLPEFVPLDLELETVELVPAIDPLSTKNRALPGYLARATVEEFGVDLARSLLLRVSRFDPWKDSLGVVEVWRAARQAFGELQLALIGAMASDDPEGWEIYRQLERETHGERDLFLLTNQMGVASFEVNAFQRVADVVIQKSIREGFGLIVSEALWKGAPLVAGRAGGIPTQLEDGVSGYLAEDLDEFVDRVVHLLEDPVHARQLGAAGARRVRERFLLARLLRDKLRVLRDLVD